MAHAVRRGWAVTAALPAALAALAAPVPADWPCWAGPEGTMSAREGDLPDSFEPVRYTPPRGKDGDEPNEPPLKPGRNVKWVVRTGFRTNGSPVVAQGRVLLGTAVRGFFPDKRRGNERGSGLLLCVDERTGELLWRLHMPQLLEKIAPHSDSGFGVCSTPTVEGDRVYVVSSRGELLCLDLRGQANGNDGPFTDEGTFLAGYDARTCKPLPPVEVKATDGDIIWLYDMIRELKVHPHDGSSSSVLVDGDVLYVCTGNGRAANDRDCLEPLAPSLAAFDKRTGRLIAWDGEEIGTRLLKGQWSTPALCRLADGRKLIIYGAGDGFCYAFEPARPRADGGIATLRCVWATDCNPPEYRVKNGQPIVYEKKNREGPSEVMATPVCWNGRVYVGVGREPAYGFGKGCLVCIDAADGRIVWSYKGVGWTMSTAAIADGRLYAADLGGGLYCLDPASGRANWTQRAGRKVWASLHVAGGKIYLGTDQGLVAYDPREGGKPPPPIRTGTIVGTPCSANGTLFVADQHFLYAIAAEPASPAAHR